MKNHLEYVYEFQRQRSGRGKKTPSTSSPMAVTTDSVMSYNPNVGTTDIYGLDSFFYECANMYSKFAVFDFEHYLACRKDQDQRSNMTPFQEFAAEPDGDPLESPYNNLSSAEIDRKIEELRQQTK